MVRLDRGDEVVVGGDSPIRYQLASVSKQFTAAALLLLAQERRVRLDDPLDRWIAGWPGVTLHHLLAHTSGIGHWDDYPMIDLGVPVGQAELVDAFRAVPPLFRPGADWRYSSPAYVLAAQVVERVADMAYPEFLAHRVFGPAGLTATFAGASGDRADIAAGHDEHGASLPSWDLQVVGMGAGDVWSTTGDMVRWMSRLWAGDVLCEPWRTLMLTERAPTGQADEHSRGYGYGWFVGCFGGEPWFQHSGHNAGYKTFAACLPRSDRRIVVLCNSEAMDPPALFTLLRSLL
ncbi:serine hydrolase [Couchioplanes caeruleus subsp. caeruleus]|uniref:Serine hydrolase n=1 Tax=Couchioplanes caeruleus subsp. caeruleus TaxID=56427 RepID=A0A1K0G744_9ACTN|nr:serine hydrolase [Couchioplanes caeruleus subsp. caeruleus]